MNKLLRIITALICLSPFQAFAMEKEEKPIVKCDEAWEKPSPAITEFFSQVLTDYDIDPDKHRNSCF